MELIDPLNGAAKPKTQTVEAGYLLDPLRIKAPASPVKAGYELGNLDLCPDCAAPMEKMMANDVLSNVCIAHRVCLPVKDAE